MATTILVRASLFDRDEAYHAKIKTCVTVVSNEITKQEKPLKKTERIGIQFDKVSLRSRSARTSLCST